MLLHDQARPGEEDGMRDAVLLTVALVAGVVFGSVFKANVMVNAEASMPVMWATPPACYLPTPTPEPMPEPVATPAPRVCLAVQRVEGVVCTGGKALVFHQLEAGAGWEAWCQDIGPAE